MEHGSYNPRRKVSWYTRFQNDNFIDEQSKTKGTVMYQIILIAILKAQIQLKNRIKSFGYDSLLSGMKTPDDLKNVINTSAFCFCNVCVNVQIRKHNQIYQQIYCYPPSASICIFMAMYTHTCIYI